MGKTKIDYTKLIKERSSKTCWRKSKLSKYAIDRLKWRAGVLLMTEDMSELIEHILNAHTARLIHHAIYVAENKNHTIPTRKDVLYAMSLNGKPMYV
jgi:histone H3/H4